MHTFKNLTFSPFSQGWFGIKLIGDAFEDQLILFLHFPIDLIIT